ncbi:hypothetical protein DIPPA_16282 [Diplonema papillatum]|nr:hypothetical protein DIPPA_16282 [Diplonema papillatum]
MPSKKFRPAPRVPVSVAAPSMKRVRGHEDDGVDPALLSAKPYKITKKAAEVKQKGNCGGCGVDVDVKPEPADPLSHAAMARLRGQVLGGTLPRLVKTPPADIKLRKEKTVELWELLTKAMGGKVPAVTGRSGRFAKMGVKGHKWELFVWNPAGDEAVGIGYGTFTEALHMALDSAIAALMEKVKKMDEETGTQAPPATGGDDSDESDAEAEEDEEGEEVEEIDEDNDEDLGDSSTE